MLKEIKKVIIMVVTFIIMFNSISFSIYGSEKEEKETIKVEEKAEKESIKEIYEALKENETVTVSIWLNVNENQEVEKKVKKKTGLDFSNISVIDEELSDEFVEEFAEYSNNPNGEPSKEFVKEMKDYLKATEKNRKKEKENTDLFLSEYRNEMKNEVNNRVDGFKENHFSNDIDKVIYSDELVPLIIAEIDKDEMKKLEKDSRISSIELMDLNLLEAVAIDADVATSYDENKTFEEGLAECKKYTGIDILHEKLSWRGKDVGVGLIETSTLLDGNNEIPSSRLKNNKTYANLQKKHVVYTSTILAGTSGIAPEATVYSYGIGETVSVDKYASVLNWFIKQKVSIVNMSNGVLNQEGSYTDYEKYFDFIIESYRITVVQSAGNEYSERILAPGLSSNIITVGACDHVETLSKTDDVRCDFSSYYNYLGNGIAKPDFVAQGVYGDTEGTSLSAPYVTGVIALMAELRPSIVANPHLIKAILMASCQYKAKPATSTEAEETMASGLTECQGAGIVDPYLALCITAQKNYYTGTINDGSEFLYYLTKPSYNSTGLNISLAWLNISSEAKSNTTVENLQKNLDLYVYKELTDTLLGRSRKTKSSTEMAYITDISYLKEYRIKVNNLSEDDNFAEFAIAWCGNNEHYNYRYDMQGIFSLKNKKGTFSYNNKDVEGFLATMDTKYIYLKESPFASSAQWIMRPIEEDYYSLQSIYSGKNDTHYLGKSNITWYNEYNAVSDASTNYSFTIEVPSVDGYDSYEEGTVRFRLGDELLGLSDRTYGSYGKYAIWSTQFSDSDTTYWYLNRVDYKEGDANLDYALNSSDANLILNIAAVKEEPVDNLIAYLCDANGDGVINSADALLVLKIAAKSI